MGRFQALLPEQRDLMLSLAKAYRDGGHCTFWIVGTIGRSWAHSVRGNCQIDNVPTNRTFYAGLERDGFLDLGSTDKGGIMFTIRPTIMDYADYTGHGPVARWWLDRWFDLTSGKPAWAEVIKLLLAAGLGAVGTQIVINWLF